MVGGTQRRIFYPMFNHEQAHDFKKQEKKYFFRRLYTVVAGIAVVGVDAFFFELAAAYSVTWALKRLQAYTIYSTLNTL